MAPADHDFRTAGPDALAAALRASRADTLATLAHINAALPDLQVPQHDTSNPPRWELGHIGWFAQHWLARNPQRQRGTQADPQAPRSLARAPDSDALFDSSRVPHSSRWHLALPGVAALRESLEEGLRVTLGLLQHGDDSRNDSDSDSDSHSDSALYFYRLVLAHEDMHHEAALCLAQALGLPALHDGNDRVDVPPRWQASRLDAPRHLLAFDAAPFDQGWRGAGFAFDNELGAFTTTVPAFEIDSRVLSWADYLPFAEAGGYRQPRWWCSTGRAWLRSSGAQGPRYLRGSPWQVQVGGQWQALDVALPACHLNAFEAEAWCAWAGRRLPSESEWERAAAHVNGQPGGQPGGQAAPALAWGAVWEWTCSPFTPYPGFVAHPYQDYSAPWFGSRRVLRGASFATQKRLHHLRYRNFYTPERNDIFAGFRSCAL